ncbi:MAG: STAS domain-containing protein [Ignavibacteriales bacterium]|nr:STAS domain-containing protein [Ignavibacteriales bacterium]
MLIKSKTILDGKIAIIEIRGALIGDEGTDEFRREIMDFIEQGNRNLIVNLQRVNYMNSSGIGAIVSAQTSYIKNGGEIKLVGLTKNVLNLFAVTKLIEIFDVHEKADDAIKSFLSEKSTDQIKSLINNLQE